MERSGMCHPKTSSRRSRARQNKDLIVVCADKSNAIVDREENNAKIQMVLDWTTTLNWTNTQLWKWKSKPGALSRNHQSRRKSIEDCYRKSTANILETPKVSSLETFWRSMFSEISNQRPVRRQHHENIFTMIWWFKYWRAKFLTRNVHDKTTVLFEGSRLVG